MPGDVCEVVLYSPDHQATFGLPRARSGHRRGRPVGRSAPPPWGAPRHRLRAGVREPGRGGGGHHRPPSWSDLRVRSRAAPGARRARRPSVAGAGSDERRAGARSADRGTGGPGCPGPPDGPTRWWSRPSRPSPTCRRWRPTDAATWPRCWATSSSRLDRLFGEPMPYMMWFHQRPFDGQRLARGLAARPRGPAAAGAGHAPVRGQRRAGRRHHVQPGRSRRRGRRPAPCLSVTAPADPGPAPAPRWWRVAPRAGEPHGRPHRLRGRLGAADGHRSRPPRWSGTGARSGAARPRTASTAWSSSTTDDDGRWPDAAAPSLPDWGRYVAAVVVRARPGHRVRRRDLHHAADRRRTVLERGPGGGGGPGLRRRRTWHRSSPGAGPGLPAGRAPGFGRALRAHGPAHLGRAASAGTPCWSTSPR